MMTEAQKIIVFPGFEIKDVGRDYSIRCRTCPMCWLIDKTANVPMSEILELLNHQAMHVRLPRPV